LAIRALIVDDSAVARKILAEVLQADGDIEVVAASSSPGHAKARMAQCQPDVIALDAMMEPIDGLTFLRMYMATTPIPTVLVSAAGSGATRAAALCAGAQSVVEKPSGWDPASMDSFARELRASIRRAARTRPRRPAPKAAPTPTPTPTPTPAANVPITPRGPRPTVIAIGTSTGGAAALAQILPRFPADAPPIVIVDHMPAGYTKEFAASLDPTCSMTVLEASHGQELKAGLILVAPGGDLHTEVVRRSGKLTIRLVDGPPVSGHRPSVDVLLRSVAREAGKSAAAGLLTGMGRDGAEGMLALRRAGGFTIAQNEATSVVYGMPKAASELGGATMELALDDIPRRLLLGG